MTIPGGGGGGKKIPALGGASAPEPPKTAKITSKTTTAITAATAPPPASDGFEHTRTDPRPVAHRAGVPASDAPATVSGIENMVRILEDTRTQILDEHQALRDQACKLVKALAEAGFERSLLDAKSAELTQLRLRLAALRKRLQHIQRRLKAAVGKSAKHGDIDISKSMQAHLDKMKKLEPGVQRALLALLAMEQACGSVVDGGVLKLVGDVSAQERGSALARLAPHSMAARATTALLTGKSERALGPGASASANTVDDVAGFAGLRAVAETLLASF